MRKIYNKKQWDISCKSADKDRVVALCVVNVNEPIFHPCVNNTFDRYGEIVAWSTEDAANQFALIDERSLIFINREAACLLHQGKIQELEKINDKMVDSNSCNLCGDTESDRSKLFACSSGDMFHKACIVDQNGIHVKSCPVCECDIN